MKLLTVPGGDRYVQNDGSNFLSQLIEFGIKIVLRISCFNFQEFLAIKEPLSSKHHRSSEEFRSSKQHCSSKKARSLNQHCSSKKARSLKQHRSSKKDRSSKQYRLFQRIPF